MQKSPDSRPYIAKDGQSLLKSPSRVHEQINRRTRVAGLFPNKASLLRLVSAVLMELSKEWETGKRYLNMDVENETTALDQNKIYRKNVA